MSRTSSGLRGQASIVTSDNVLQHAPLCGDFEIEIDRHGTWYYCNSPIGRPALVKLFASVLRRVGDEYWLVTPVEQGRIVVADVPFVAVAVTVAGMGRDQVLSFRTNLDEWVTAGPEHPIWVDIAPGTGEPRPYIEVRAGLAARIARPVYYELAELAETEPRRADASGQTMEHKMAEYGVWSKGRFFLLA